jgi:hypothetical protein
MARLTLLIVLGMTTLGGCQRAGEADETKMRWPTSPTPPSPMNAVFANADMEGGYTLTFTADSLCTDLPHSVRTRTYTAMLTRHSVDPSAGEIRGFSAELSGADFYPNYGTFSVNSRRPAPADFYLYSQYAMNRWLEEVPIFERLASGGFVALSGVAKVPFNRSVPAELAALEGTFTYCATPRAQTDPPACAEPVICTSKNHTLALARR